MLLQQQHLYGLIIGIDLTSKTKENVKICSGGYTTLYAPKNAGAQCTFYFFWYKNVPFIKMILIIGSKMSVDSFEPNHILLSDLLFEIATTKKMVNIF